MVTIWDLDIVFDHFDATAGFARALDRIKQDIELKCKIYVMGLGLL